MKIPLETLAQHAAEISPVAAPSQLAPAFDWPTIGTSREGRPIEALRVGSGDRRVSLIAGCHADEPIGPRTLLAFAKWLGGEEAGAAELRKLATWSIVPHVHPDGGLRNASWAEDPEPPLETYLLDAVRDRPGDDVEFGFPRAPDDDGARPENRAVAEFLADGGPYDVHATLHGMFIAEGAWFLIDRDHVDTTKAFRRDIVAECARVGIPLHDWDRGGEKGFVGIEPGFSTSPTSVAMREHFLARGDRAEAAKFRPSSMEFVASLGGNPVALVSEVPLFLVERGAGGGFLRAKDALVEAQLALAGGDPRPFDAAREKFGFEPVPVELASRLQLAMVLLALGVPADAWEPPGLNDEATES